MKLFIKIVSGEFVGRDQTFDQDEVTISRSDTADVQVHPEKEAMVGRAAHVRLQRRGDAWFAFCEHDNGLTLHANGTATQLAKGDEAQLGKTAEITVGPHGPRLRLTTIGAVAPGTIKGGTEFGGDSMPEIGNPGTHRKARTAGRKALTAGALACVVAVVIGAFLFSAYRQVHHETHDLRELTSLHAAGMGDLRTFMEAEAAQREAEVAALREQYGELDETLRSTLEAKLRTMAPAVFAVGALDEHGNYSHVGTAWLARADGDERAILATNAHVATDLLMMSNQGLRIVARNWVNGQDYPLQVTVIHPGYEAWEAGVSTRRFVATAIGIGPIGGAALACDTALLTVPGGVNPDIKPLSLAGPTDAFLVEPGDEVGYVGFPSEHVAVRITASPPIIDIGRSTRITDFFGRARDLDTMDVLEHTLTIHGGASGSPIFNRDGLVIGIINSGSMVFAGGQRIPFGLNYAHHVRFVHEVLDETADQMHVNRYQGWRSIWEELLLDHDAMADHIARSVLREIRSVVPDAILNPTLSREVRIAARQPGSGGEPQQLLVPLDLPAPGVYVVLGVEPGGTALRVEMLGQTSGVSPYPHIIVMAERTGGYQATLRYWGILETERDVLVRVYRIEANR